MSKKITTAKQRLVKLFLLCIMFVLAGVIYGVFVKRTGIAVPCAFRLVTGLQCPGCGVTHMCMALLQLNAVEAFESHPMLFVQLPVWCIMVLKNMISYVQHGFYRITQFETVVIYIGIILLVVFAVFRNIM